MKISIRQIQIAVVAAMFIVIVTGLLVGCTSPGSTYFITPGLNDERTKSVVVGMTPAAVEAAIGKPYQRIRFANLYATSWDYRYVDTFGYITEFSVMVADNGRVVETISTRAIANAQ